MNTSFWRYVKENKMIWFVVFGALLLCHGSMLLSTSMGIDTEDIIQLQSDFYGGWLITGRQGLVFLKLLTDTYAFNPYFAGICTLLFMTLSCILWTYLFTLISGKKNTAGIYIFSFIIASSTVLTEQFYFKLQAMEISICFCLMAICLYLAYRFALDKKWWGLLGCLPLILITFSSYQVMTALFLFGAVTCFFLYYIYHVLPSDSTVSLGKLWAFIGRFAAAFLCGFAINQLITSLFFSGSSYLSGQLNWLNQPFSDCLMGIIRHIGGVLFGSQIFYTKTFAIYCLALFIAVIYLLFKKKGQKGKVLCFLTMGLVFLSPFYMTIICGGQPVVRSQLVLPFTFGFIAYLLFLLAENKKRGWTYALVILGVLTCFIQVRYTSLLNYSDDVRAKSDERIAASMIDSINDLQDEECSYPVVFIGSHPAELNNACITGESIGRSFFEWDTAVEPLGLYSSRRILGLMHVMGVNYLQADAEETAAALTYSEKMPDWPAKGSITKQDGVIIIKLSDYE